MQYAIEQRLRLIDFLLVHYGYFSRETIMDYFGTGPATTTRDIAEYRARNPQNLVLDQSAKLWRASLTFKRAYE